MPVRSKSVDVSNILALFRTPGREREKRDCAKKAAKEKVDIIPFTFSFAQSRFRVLCYQVDIIL